MKSGLRVATNCNGMTVQLTSVILRALSIGNTRLEPCLHPPSCEQLVDILVALIESNGNYESQAQAEKFNRLAKHMRRSSPDKQWLLAGK